MLPRRVLLQLYDFSAGRSISTYFDDLCQSQWLAKPALQELQLSKLKRLFQHAYASVPYYRELLNECGVVPDKIRDESDILKVPFLTKELVRNNFSRLKSSALGPKSLFPSATGGSTGEPLRFVLDRTCKEYMNAVLYRNLTWCGWAFGECHASIWGGDYDQAFEKSARKRLQDFLMNHFQINAFSLSSQTMDQFVRLIRKRRPKVLVGYASALYHFTKYLKQRSISDITFDAVESSAEVLHPPQRQQIEDTLTCKVFDRYGCREAGNIAHECASHAGLHVNAETHLVEVINSDGKRVAPGETGEIVFTSLINYGMPFIRYRTGDLGRLASRHCECARQLPLLEVVKGRITDMLIGEGGKGVHGEFFTHLFYGVHGVDKFQVVQKARNRLIVYVVKGEGFEASSLQSVVAAIKDMMGDGCMVELQFPEDIQRERSGKYRFTICEVS
ncbi:MAG: hypothetical protein M1305_06320 [Candidatus Marsarchaeota archaeon]|nr:hypothetical protein [Candidatus Marsarchaeota archaeon]